LISQLGDGKSHGCSDEGFYAFSFLLMIQITLYIAFFTSLCVTFTLDGVPRDISDAVVYGYTPIGIGISLVSEFESMSPGGGIALFGSYFISAFYIMTCIILPVISTTHTALAAFFPPVVIGGDNPRHLQFFFCVGDLISAFSFRISALRDRNQ